MDNFTKTRFKMKSRKLLFVTTFYNNRKFKSKVYLKTENEFLFEEKYGIILMMSKINS